MDEKQRPIVERWASLLPDSPRVLETGCMRWGDDSTRHDHVRPDAEWTGSDYENGQDVDVVIDLQNRESLLAQGGRYDGILSIATLEHVQRPWIAVENLSYMAADGGHILIDTHQTFPLHGYPNDYFRFSTEALELMCKDAGLTVIDSGYLHPCSIVPDPPLPVWNEVAEAYCNVWVLAKK